MDILLVDDDQQLTMLLKMQFEDRGDQVRVVHNGYDGVDLALHMCFDAIILDLMLPGMNGRNICARLRDRQVKVPILVISSLDTVTEKLETYKSGADEYLTKPVLFEQLYDIILRLVSIPRDPESGNNNLH